MSLRAFFAALAASALVVAVTVGLWTWRTGGDAGEHDESADDGQDRSCEGASELGESHGVSVVGQVRYAPSDG